MVNSFDEAFKIMQKHMIYSTDDPTILSAWDRVIDEILNRHLCPACGCNQRDCSCGDEETELEPPAFTMKELLDGHEFSKLDPPD